MSEQPQPWDPAKVTLAVTDAISSVRALASDASGDAYRQEIQRLAEWRLEPAESESDYIDRLAYVLYGFALFGVGALKCVETEVGLDREEALRRIGQSVDDWLG